MNVKKIGLQDGGGIISKIKMISKIYIKLRFRDFKARAKSLFIKLCNKFIAIKYIDVGAGRGKEQIFWFDSDFQNDSFVINETSKFPIKKESLSFAYSSHFFEHINDGTASNVLSDVFSFLKKGAVFRIVVPDHQIWIEKYLEGDIDFLINYVGKDNLSTWHIHDVEQNPEQLLIALIKSFHNKSHKIVDYPHLEDSQSSPPSFMYPHHSKLDGYYCGPIPYISSNEIVKKLNQLDKKHFVEWVLDLNETPYLEGDVFNSWHKNNWYFDKLKSYATKAGFSSIEKSHYGETSFQLLKIKDRESTAKIPFSLYFNLIK